jgi:alpha-amylase
MKNGVMLQAFQWHAPDDGQLWTELRDRAAALATVGFTSIWLPPAYKSHRGSDDVGYGVYDLHDLGEFDQKGAVRTRYGTKAELIAAVRALRGAGLQVCADVVLNHRLGADELEPVRVRPVRAADRDIISDSVIESRAWSRFTYAGRGGAHSVFEWRAEHFTAFDYIDPAPATASERMLYLMQGKRFSEDVSSELGNFDYLMGCDVDQDHPDVRAELCAWARWFVDTTGVDGVRLDAVKHFPSSFVRDLLGHLRNQRPDRELYAVSEYWSGDAAEMLQYVESTESRTDIFDVPLHLRLADASRAGKAFDLRTVFNGSIVAARPDLAVTFVDNHDTEPGQSLQSWVEPWFKPLAYALILLRRDGYPCVYAADYWGGPHAPTPLQSFGPLLDTLLQLRHAHGHGEQHDYFEQANCIAWVRTGDAEHAGPMVVVLSNGDEGRVRINVGVAGATFVDAVKQLDDRVVTDADGMGEFGCPAGSMAVWVPG